MMTKGLVASLVLASALAAPAHGQAGVHFVGSTQGCFAASIGACSFSNTATLGGLTYTSQSLALQTDNTGYSAAGNPTNGFGLLSLTNTPFAYTGNNFFLQVVFGPIGTTNSAGGPSNATTANTPTYSAVLRGSVIANAANNGVTIDFGGAQSQNFVFTSTAPGATLGGTGVLSVFNKAVNAGDPNAAISGELLITPNVTGSSVPEPSSIALLATGLLGIVGAAARRRRNA